MTILPTSRPPETALQKETRLFREQMGRLFGCLLNKIFDLSDKGSQRRFWMLGVAFLALGILFRLILFPASGWRNEFGHLMTYLLNPAYAQVAPTALLDFLEFALGPFFEPKMLRLLPVLILPFVIALQAAATYLADIFELKQVSIARNFIMQVALTGNHKHIRIRSGEVVEEDRSSPIYLIGGPGKVLVELDSAALFERADGRPHVIGPTVKGKATLEGFERFRDALDLRDQYTEPLKVNSRSLDGIPISAADVRLVFSIFRNNEKPTAEFPHPFKKEAIETLVYGKSARVTTEGPFPSELPTSWTGAIQGMIRGELGSFMSKHKLVEYLASVGLPETQQAKQREEEIVSVGKRVLSDEDTPEPRPVPPPPDFKPRRVISNLFSQFTEGFTQKASQRGLELHWIGVGTWRPPSEIVPNKHVEAWNLSLENLARGNQGALDGLKQAAHLQQILRLIQNIPLGRFQQNHGNDHRNALRDMLIGYREQFIETIELLRKSRRPVPSSLPAAIKHIETVLGLTHWVGGAGPTSGKEAGGSTSPSRPLSARPRASSTTGVPSTPPISPEEEDLYRELLTMARGDVETAERLIENERKKAPRADRLEWIRRAISHWRRDNQ
ncbi:MAG: hypothetical protein Fur0043_03330 [Anaerolineales bacterium]